ncbi:MAG: tRNA uridine-5-carboxymethylaminomethyl(34) synthesis enzyme MnmG [Pseudomonadota bacterium]
MFHVKHDVIVVGGGHAGCEAALAAARVGAEVALVTLDAAAIGRLSCNPAIGGIGKGHLVREIDALGGAMSHVADHAGIQFRLLNRSRGPAVRGPRAQVDRDAYREAMQATIAAEKTLTVVEGEAADLLMDGANVAGLVLADGCALPAAAVVITTGTFLSGLIHLGDRSWPAGRMGEAAASALAARLRAANLPIGRLKTGTPPRLKASTIAFDALEPQPGDTDIEFFAEETTAVALTQKPCHITHTTEATHALVRDNLDRSAMYSGRIEGVGPRYCPSIEDKIVRFDRPSHQVFLEPEGVHSDLIYPNGISNSLPEDVQRALVHSMPGCANAKIAQPGYAIEYDMVDPRALTSTLEVRALKNLFLAGQINGTTGYEEAAAQGLLAGLNAARRAGGADGVTIARSEAYLGVMVDDLIANGVDEPYRMFTSRAEHRLTLRADNAADRLTARGIALGLVRAPRAAAFHARQAQLGEATAALKSLSLTPQQTAAIGVRFKADGKKRDGFDILAHDDGGLPAVAQLLPGLADLPRPISDTLFAEALYRIHTDRQRREAAGSAAIDGLKIPASLAAGPIPGLSNELSEKLAARQPATLGEARRISGMTAAGLALIAAHARRAA